MRVVIALTLGLSLSACAPSGSSAPANTPAAVPNDAKAGSSGAGRSDGDRGPVLDPVSLIGTWSFDRSCASEDGMLLAADGTASHGEWGPGMWAVDAEHRLVLIVREHEMGKEPDPFAERHVLVFTAIRVVGDDLAARRSPSRAGQPPAEINAKRCPQSR